MSRWVTHLRSTAAMSVAVSLLSIQPTAMAGPLDNRLFSDAQLFELAMDTYNRSDWIYAALHLYAYMQRNPAVLRNDPVLAKQVVDALYYSERQMEKARDEAGRLSTCQQQLAGRPEVGANVAGLTAAAPTVNWNKIKSAAHY